MTADARLREFVALALQCPSELDSADRENVAAFQRLRPFDWANCSGDWERATQDLDDHSLTQLLKVVVLAERDFKWIGGSAASGIQLYRLLCERCPAAQREVADWVFRHRGDNPWMPLGTTLYQARSWDEAQQQLRAIEARQAARRAAGELKQAAQRAAAADRKERHRVAGAEHRVRSVAKNESRKALVESMAGISLIDRVNVVLESRLPLDAFPASLLSEIGDASTSVPTKTLTDLRAAIGERRGAWRKVAKIIDRLLGER